VSIRGYLYRSLMKLAHRFDWHYAPVIGPLSPPSEDGRNYQRWCRWCGFRQNLHPTPEQRISVILENIARGEADRG